MKYKLQVEKLKQITLKNMDGNLAMANKFENQDDYEQEIKNQMDYYKIKEQLEDLNESDKEVFNKISDNLRDNNHKDSILNLYISMRKTLTRRHKTIQYLDKEIDMLSKENTKLIEILNIRNKESEQQDVLFTMLFEFAEWAALNYVRLNGVWCHKYAPQTNKDCWITTDKLFEVYKYKNEYSSQAGRV